MLRKFVSVLVMTAPLCLSATAEQEVSKDSSNPVQFESGAYDSYIFYPSFESVNISVSKTVETDNCSYAEINGTLLQVEGQRPNTATFVLNPYVTETSIWCPDPEPITQKAAQEFPLNSDFSRIQILVLSGFEVSLTPSIGIPEPVDPTYPAVAE